MDDAALLARCRMRLEQGNAAQDLVLHIFYECLRSVTQGFAGLFVKEGPPGLAAEIHHPFQLCRSQIAPAIGQPVSCVAAPGGFHDDDAQLGRFEGIREGAVGIDPAAGKLAAGRIRPRFINTATAVAHEMAAHAGFHFMSVDRRRQPAVAARSAIPACARRITGRAWLDRGYLYDLAAAFLVFLAAAARAWIVSTGFHCANYLSLQGVIMMRVHFFCCIACSGCARKLFKYLKNKKGTRRCLFVKQFKPSRLGLPGIRTCDEHQLPASNRFRQLELHQLRQRCQLSPDGNRCRLKCANSQHTDWYAWTDRMRT